MPESQLSMLDGSLRKAVHRFIRNHSRIEFNRTELKGWGWNVNESEMSFLSSGIFIIINFYLIFLEHIVPLAM